MIEDVTSAPIGFTGLLLACLALVEPAWAEPPADPRGRSDGPWFTGTLLSSRGTTVEQGHAIIEPYFFYTRYGGLYNDNWRLQSEVRSEAFIQQTYFIYGLTSRIDLEIAPQWLGMYARGESSTGFGDFPLLVGFQAFRSPPHSWWPDVRIWAQEMFPTGRHDDLAPSRSGLGGTGGGSYATTIGIGIQKAIDVDCDHVFRYRVNLTYGFYSPVTVKGFNTYGGGFGTDGTVDPGSVATVTVAGEYTLTRHVVLALDIGFQTVNATRFSGTPGVNFDGDPATVGKGYSNVLTVAPALEYLWNEHIGIIAGPWMSLRGRNTSEFFGAVAALYLFL